MTVYDLRAKLSKLDGQKPVVVYWEDENKTHFAEIDGISVKKGVPKNLANGKTGFEFEPNGPAEWAFIEVIPYGAAGGS
jgi:hypothetical protein